jgi:hypothetical protein
MSAAKFKTINPEDVQIQKGSIWAKIPMIAAPVGLMGIIGTLLVPAEGHANYFAYLTAFLFFLSIALGSLFFCMIFFLTRSGWNVAVRRIAEASMVTLPVFALLFIPVLLGMEHIYHWMDPHALATDPILQAKAPYLNTPFFLGRAAFYFLVWSGLAFLFRSNSVKQDTTGDEKPTYRLQALAAPGIALGALTLTFAAFDWNMSIDYHWFSTMYGVIFFAGGFMGNFAVLILMIVAFRSNGFFKDYVTVEHQHGAGKMMFGMTCFWAYVSFSQFVLIWYANIPEETIWFQHRWDGSWKVVSMFLLLGHFVVPFFFFMSAHMKRNKTTATIAALWMLGMHYVDMYWMVMPNVYHGDAHFGLAEILSFVGVGGVFVAAFTFMLGRAPLIPVKDPRLPESLAFQN